MASNRELARRLLVRGFSSYQIHYFAQLPYNLNWMLESLETADSFFAQHPIRVTDVGARGGCPEELSGLKPYLRYDGFEVDQTACQAMEVHRDPLILDQRVHNCFVGGFKGATRFHVCEPAGASSALEPNSDLRDDYEIPVVKGIVELTATTLDELIDSGKLEAPDFLKLDTQGTELEILKAAKSALQVCNLVEVEVEFVPLYRGMSLFPDVCSFMFQNGYELLYLNRVFQSKKGYPRPSRGQIAFADALFGRPEAGVRAADPTRTARYVVLLANYGHLDLAFRIYDRLGIRRIVNLDFLFSQPALSPQEQELAVARDKELCWQLSARQTNQISSDSDRSWPFR